MSKILTVISLVFIIVGSLSGCKHDKEELLYPDSSCDTTNVKYSTTIVPILVNNCYRCHAGATPTAPFRLDSYNAVQAKAADGELWGAVSHAAGFVPMPKDAAALGECDLAKIKKWLDDGYPDN